MLVEYHTQFWDACEIDTASSEVGRAASRMSLITAAGELAIEIDVLPWEPGTAIDAVAKCFAAWRNTRGGDQANYDDERALETVRLFIGRFGNSRFEEVLRHKVGYSSANAQTPQAEPPVRQRINDRAGYKRNGPKGVEYLVFDQVFQTEVCGGHLREHKGRHWTISTTLPGSKAKVSVYCVLESILSSGGGGVEDSEDEVAQE